MTAQDVLDRAADLIEEYGWRQRMKISMDDQSLCAGEAIDTVCDYRGIRTPADLGDLRDEAMTKFAQRICPRIIYDDPASSAVAAVVNWNDRYGVTQEKVLATLRRHDDTD